MFIHELSRPQSSLFSHAIITGGNNGGGSGRFIDSSNGGGLTGYPVGDGLAVVEPSKGTISSKGSSCEVADIGGFGEVGSSISNAVHLIFGFPVVPDGQMHVGLCPMVLQSASSPHSPWKQMSMHNLLTQVLSIVHWSLLSHPTEIGGGVGGFGGCGADGKGGEWVTISPIGDAVDVVGAAIG